MIDSKEEIKKLNQEELDFFKSFVYECSDETAVVFDSNQEEYIIVDIADISKSGYRILTRLNLDPIKFKNYFENVDTFYLKDVYEVDKGDEKMNKATIEDELNASLDLLMKDFLSNETREIHCGYVRDIFNEISKTPTIEEVIKAWEEKEGWLARESSSTLEIYSEWSKEVYYRIDFDTYANGIWQNPRYPKRTMQQDDLIQLTRRYLQSQKENAA